MKAFSCILLILCCLFLPTGSQGFIFKQERAVIDPKLVGSWEGETIQKDGTLKKWRQIRYAKGRYTIQFNYYASGKRIDGYTATGRWWMHQGRFCEIPDSLSGQHFEYKVTWLSDSCIRMTSVKRNPNGDEYEGYTFTECQVDSNLSDWSMK